MGKATSIEWTHHTFNPWWGCVRVSPGCEHCYAETFAKRTGHKVWGVQAERRFFGEKHWREPLKWNADAEKAGERRRVFCASMADVFEDRDNNSLAAPRARLFRLVQETPHLDWLLLTKRPENADKLWRAAHIDAWNGADSLGLTWLPNVWLGTTAEDQRRANERIPHLLRVPAAVRFVSYEPALEAVDFRPLFEAPDQNRPHAACGAQGCDDCGNVGYEFASIDWVIVGSESGPRARPGNLDWYRSARDQCVAAGVAFFFKQHVVNGKKLSTPELDGKRWAEYPQTTA